MSPSLPKFANGDVAVRLFTESGQEFAVVENLSHVYPPYDLYPLTPARPTVNSELRAAVMDMDGTTTTTEPLCINALETMVGRITGGSNDPNWPGLNPKQDYPHIIGNSTTRHVEYLLQTYGDAINPPCFMRSLVRAAAWTLGFSQDKSRKQDLEAMLALLGVAELKLDSRFQSLMCVENHDGSEEHAAIEALADEFSGAFPANNFSCLTRACVEIYYQRYHELLSAVAIAKGKPLPSVLKAPSDGLLIEPMPGIGAFLALITGLLGDEAPKVLSELSRHLKDSPPLEGTAARLTQLGATFAKNPAQVALVTSSIAYEAGVVLGEVFRQLHNDVAAWGLSEERATRIQQRFGSAESFYDAIITASDSCEMRLKPHRDLYSLALGRLGLHPSEFGDVVGFEDSESGTIAIRAAGISVCCALPFHMTAGHVFHAASHTCVGGLPEVILRENCFLARQGRSTTQVTAGAPPTRM